MERKNTGWKVLTLILFISLLGTSGFITYDKVLKDKYFTKKDDKKEEKKEKNNTDNKTADELYAEYLENLKENAKNINVASQDYKDELAGMEFSVRLKDGFLTVNYVEDGVNDQTNDISKNVLRYFVLPIGQGSMKVVYYITEDGKVYSNNISESTKSNELSNLKNIVDVIPVVTGSESGSVSTVFVDIEGNMFESDGEQINVE